MSLKDKERVILEVSTLLSAFFDKHNQESKNIAGYFSRFTYMSYDYYVLYDLYVTTNWIQLIRKLIRYGFKRITCNQFSHNI